MRTRHAPDDPPGEPRATVPLHADARLEDSQPPRRRAGDRLDGSGFVLLGASLALLGTIHVLVRTSAYGAGIDIDSVFYLSIAANWLAGHGFQDFVGNTLHPWPPLFPLLLAAVGFVLGIEPHDAARFVNAAAFGLTILVAALWLRRTASSCLVAFGATLAVATSPYVGHVASIAMTEALFILFVLLALMQFDSFANRRPSGASLALAALWSALAATTRYAGVAVVVTGMLLLVMRSRRSLAGRTGQAMAFGGASLLPVAVVAMRNLLLFGSWDRPRGDPGWGQSVFESLGQVARLAGSAVAPPDGPEWLAPLLWASAALLIACVAVVAAPVGRRFRRGKWTESPLATLGAFGLVYTTFIVAAVSSGRAWDPGMSWRFVIPLYVPALIVAALALDRWIRLATVGWRTGLKWTVAGVVLLGGAGSVVAGARTSIHETIWAMESGYRAKLFNTAYWDDSETIRYLRDNPAAPTVHANSRFGLLHAQLALKSGDDVIGKYRGLPKQAATLTQGVEDGRIQRVVWFKFDAEVGYEYDDEEVRSLAGLVLEADLTDGLVFQSTSSVRPPAC